MSKTFSKTITFRASLSAVLDLYQSESFMLKLLEETQDPSIKTSRSDDALSLNLEYWITDLPSAFRKVVGDRIHIFDEQVLDLPLPNATSTSGKRELRSNFKQVTGMAHLNFQEHSGSTDVTYEGKVKVDVPIIGGPIEKEIRDLLLEGLDELESLGNKWLAN